MKKVIHHLRRQPEEVKRHILHFLTVVAGVILMFFWIYSLGTNFSNTDTKEKLAENLEPFSVLKDNLELPSSW